MGLSRSAYYKYKDFVFPFYEASKEKIITLSLLLEHKSGVLSKVLNTVADDPGQHHDHQPGILCRALPTQLFLSKPSI